MLAIWQNNVIRKDILTALKSAKAMGLFVVVINTGKIELDSHLSDFIDVYIERYNFGQDFVRYKLGFSFLSKIGALDECPRLIMCNDSVFYIEGNLKNHIGIHLDSDTPFLGVTQNFEKLHHLGSFFVSFNASTLNNPIFLNFWQKFRRTNVRSTNIRKGEQELSLCLSKLQGKDRPLHVVFNLSRINNWLASDLDNLFTSYLECVLDDKRTGWYRPNLSDLGHDLRGKISSRIYDIANAEHQLINLHVASDEHEQADLSINNFEEFVETFRLNSSTIEIRESFLIGILNRSYAEGSQIHNKQLSFLKMGTPILKLDAIYRGAVPHEVVLLTASNLEESESRDYLDLVLSRAWGTKSLQGIKRFAFEHGLI
jgi:hypothetical protein